MSTKYHVGMRPLVPDELHRSLADFTGTERYYRTHPDLLATDGAKYLADQAGTYWLLDIIWSVLPKVADESAVLELTVDQATRRAVVLIHDGREPKTTYHRQEVAWTDFPPRRASSTSSRTGVSAS